MVSGPGRAGSLLQCHKPRCQLAASLKNSGCPPTPGKHTGLSLLLAQDNSTVGIKATMARLSQFVRSYDDELAYHLETENKVGGVGKREGGEGERSGHV